LKPTSPKAVAAMLDHMELFAMGYSWGGFESLIVPFTPHRSATQWTAPGPALRLHIGLEHPDDLIKDIEAGFKRMTKT
jgi:cysteine-S-conjugate beta-lyase